MTTPSLQFKIHAQIPLDGMSVSCRGLVWHGVAWCGLVWLGVAWCGLAYLGVARCGMVNDLQVSVERRSSSRGSAACLRHLPQGQQVPRGGCQLSRGKEPVRGEGGEGEGWSWGEDGEEGVVRRGC